MRDASPFAFHMTQAAPVVVVVVAKGEVRARQLALHRVAKADKRRFLKPAKIQQVGRVVAPEVDVLIRAGAGGRGAIGGACDACWAAAGTQIVLVLRVLHKQTAAQSCG